MKTNEEDERILKEIIEEEDWDNDVRNYILENYIDFEGMVGIVTDILYNEFLHCMECIENTQICEFKDWYKDYTLDRLCKQKVHLLMSSRYELSGMEVLLELYGIEEDYVAVSSNYFVPISENMPCFDGIELSSLSVFDGSIFSEASERLRSLVNDYKFKEEVMRQEPEYTPVPHDILESYFNDKPTARIMCLCGQVHEGTIYPWAWDKEEHETVWVYKCSKCGRINYVRD